MKASSEQLAAISAGDAHFHVAQTPDNYTKTWQTTARIEKARKNASKMFIVRNKLVYTLELQLDITKSWTPEDAEYRDTMNYIQTRKF